MQNAQLVMENSELRMHLSFMPVEYRDYVNNMQASNHQEYRNQRKAPKVIVPNTDHKDNIVDGTSNWKMLQCHILLYNTSSETLDTALSERYVNKWTRGSRYVNV